jgi:hypothetical protein
MAEIRFVDTTIRDGPLGLWANNMRTGTMLAVAEQLDRAGFEAIETHYAHPKKLVRELKEDPWERLRLLSQRITETPLRAVCGPFKAFELYPQVLYEFWILAGLSNGGAERLRHRQREHRSRYVRLRTVVLVRTATQERRDSGKGRWASRPPVHGGCAVRGHSWYTASGGRRR